MKAIIPVAGAGKRLRPLTYTQPKPLIPVAGKPIISFIIDELCKVGITDYVFVIGYMGEKIRSYLEEKYPDLKKEYVVQNEREGLGHAIYLALDVVEEEESVFIALGDTICELDLKQMVENKDSCIAISKVEDPREFGVAEIDENGRVLKLIEKPRIPKSNQAIVGMYKINSSVKLYEALQYIIDQDKSTYGEYQLTDALMKMVDGGVRFDTIVVERWFDCGKKDILLETNALLLSKEISNIAPDSAYDNTIIIDPVFIGENCKIKNCIIGPSVSISEGVTVNESIIKNSIIGGNSTIDEVVLVDSVIGNDTAIKGVKQSLNLGDNTQIDFSA